MRKHPVIRAAEIVGSQAELARRLGITRGAVYHYSRPDKNGKPKPTPVPHCMAIHEMTGKRVTLQQLRPKDWRKYWPTAGVK